MNELIEQLKAQCSCLGSFDEQKAIDLVEDLLYSISTITCWSDDNCATLEKGVRTELIDLFGVRFNPCNPCNEIYKHILMYDEIDESTLKVYLKEDIGLTTNLIEIDDDDWSYDYIEDVLKINLVSYLASGRCGCTPETKLYIEYEAGYDLANLPECIIKPLCMFLKALIASANGCGSLEQCSNMAERALDARLSSYKIEDIEWKWTQDKETIDYYFLQMVKQSYMKRLASISQCDPLVMGNNKPFVKVGHNGSCKL